MPDDTTQNNDSNNQEYKVRSMKSDIESAQGKSDGQQTVSVPTSPKSAEGEASSSPAKEGATASATQGAPPANLPGVGTPNTPSPQPAQPSPQTPSTPQPKRPGPPQKPSIPRPGKTPSGPSPAPTQPPSRPAPGGPPRPPTDTPAEADTSSGKPRNRRRLLLLGVGALLIILFIGFEIWWFFIRGGESQDAITRPDDSALPAPEQTLPAEPNEPPPPAAQEPVVASALLRYDRTETVTIADSSAQSIQNALSQVLGLPREEGEMVRLIFLVSTGSQQQELTFDQFMRGLGAAVPEEVMAQLGQEANVFVYSPTVFDKNVCREAGREVDDCTGPRLGVSVEARDSAALAGSLRSWESSMVRDLRPLIVADISGPATPFLDATYRGIPVRYRNLPLNTTTIDYALTDTQWIVTTSKSSMFSAVDALGN